MKDAQHDNKAFHKIGLNNMVNCMINDIQHAEEIEAKINEDIFFARK